MKANSNLAVLDVLARLGAGFDIVSGGELARVLAAGGDPAKVVFSGVGKTEWEIEQALQADIMCFNIESAAELDRIDAVARRLRRTRTHLGAREPGRRPAHSSLHLDGTEGQQVRRRTRGDARAVSIGAVAARRRSGRNRLSYRITGHRARALPRRYGPITRPRRRDRRHRQPTAAHRLRRRPRHPLRR